MNRFAFLFFFTVFTFFIFTETPSIATESLPAEKQTEKTIRHKEQPATEKQTTDKNSIETVTEEQTAEDDDYSEPELKGIIGDTTEENDISVLINQPSFDEKELEKFIKDWAVFKEWTNSQKEINTLADAINNTKTINAFIEKQGWKTERYFYIMTHISSGMMAIHIEKKKEKTVKALLEQLDSIKKKEGIPEEIKKTAYEKLRQSIIALQQTKEPNIATPEEMIVIRKNLDNIVKVIPEVRSTPIGLPE